MAPQHEDSRDSDINDGCMTPGDEVVISGMSGLFSNCRNVKELSELIYNKKNAVSSENVRWRYKHPELPEQTGRIPNVSKFDSQFFKVNYRFGHAMDPMSRKILEQTYQALFDAGMSPTEIRQYHTGVFVGTCFSETARSTFYTDKKKNGLAICGCNKAMYANRVSYWLDVHGPSIAYDASCSSSALALWRGYEAIKRGECEAAIVTGSSLCLHPQTPIHFGRAMKLNMDGKTKSFDKNADGCSMSESVTVVILQKMKHAKRVYAEIQFASYVFTPLCRGPYRNADDMTDFLKTFYQKAGVSPSDVEYIEAFGSADPKADKNELQAIANVFCDGREDALKIGSIMSNLGYTESATGVVAIVKALLAYKNGKVAASINCEDPIDDIDAMKDGRMEIVTENKAIGRGYIAVNSYSLTGSNVHILLKGHHKAKDPLKYICNLPYLATVSGRHEDAVNYILQDLKTKSLDPEEIGLFHGLHETNISGHLSRGFAILASDSNKKTISLSEKIDIFDETAGPLWFVYSGMGSQWAGMGAQLMRLPIFAAAIQRCHKVLAPRGIDIVHILTSPDKTTFDNILHSFVGIAATQIGLTDVLTALGIVPDKIIGHSVGELGCAYADGCFTAEEMILSAYSRGLVSVQTQFIKGSMAAVGLGYKQVAPLCPPEIEIACHNSAESCTLSGPADKMTEFVAKLTAQGKFAKEVPSSNIAYHSRYIRKAGPDLLKCLKEIIKSPKPRSERWLSTSVPINKWDQPEAKLCSAEYHTNNLLNPVLFEETSAFIPPNAVLIEVAPHGLLQAILRRALPETCINIPLTRRGHSDNIVFLLEAIGKLYLQGYNPKVKELYPKIDYPVSTETPMLSHLMKWYHEDNWLVPLFADLDRRMAIEMQFIISTYDVEHSYLKGHAIGKKDEVYFPYAGALFHVWETLSMHFNMKQQKLNVRFHDVNFLEQPKLEPDQVLKLHVQVAKGNGYFEVKTGEDKVIMKGYVDAVKNLFTSQEDSVEIKDKDSIQHNDVYKIFNERGFYYTGEFKNIKQMTNDLNRATITWSNNWVTLLTTIIQLNVLKREHEGISEAKFIGKLEINTEVHDCVVGNIEEEEKNLEVVLTDNSVRCGGVNIENIKFVDIAMQKSRRLKLESSYGKGDPKEMQLEDIRSQPSNATLRIERIEDLDSLQWEECAEIKPENAITVYYAGLNIEDLRRASGRQPHKINSKTNLNFGMDFSGVTKSGERVMGLIGGGSATSRVSSENAILWPVPSHWSLEDAATVPLAYAHAFYCLGVKSQLYPGYRIFVHGASGALGQAVVNIALAHQCQVFATVSDMRKKKLMHHLFPSIPYNNIGLSEDETFKDLVQFNGKGCDIVISCQTGSNKEMMLECCGNFGIIIDTTQLQCNDDFDYGMYYLRVGRNYIKTDLSNIFTENRSNDIETLRLMVSEGIRHGYVRPLNRVTFAADDASRAFRFISSRQQFGRVLLNVCTNKIPFTPRLNLSPNKTQVVISWYLDDILMVNLVERLITRGASRIVLHLPKEMTNNGYLTIKKKSWTAKGVNIMVATREVNNLWNEGEEIESIFLLCNLGAEQRDLVEDMLTIDSESRKLNGLKHFVLFTKDKDKYRKVCVNRTAAGLPTTMLLVPEFAKYINTSAMYASAIDAVEHAAKSNQTFVSATIENEPGQLEGNEKRENTIMRLNTEIKDLITEIEPNELMATLDLMYVPTLTHRSTVRDDEYDSEETCIFLVPGLDGHSRKLTRLAERLKLPAVVVQPGIDDIDKSIPEMAQRLAKVILNQVKFKGKFYILGYSVGVLLALEIAAIFEKQGKEGVVWCVDASPDTLKNLVNNIDEKCEESIQNELVKHMYSVIAEDNHELNLDNAREWNEKLDLCIKTMQIRNRVKYSKQYIRLLVQSAYTKINLMRKYNCEHLKMQPLRSEIIVMRSKYQPDEHPQDLGLSKLFYQKPIVYELNKPHSEATLDLRCSNIVNEHLDQDIREAFQARNLCETYLTDTIQIFDYHHDDDDWRL